MKALNQIIFQRDLAIPGIEICSVRESRHVFPRHSHDDLYALSLMESGGSYWDGSERSSSLVTPGEIAIINPGEVHSGEPRRDSTTYKMIYLQASILTEDRTVPQFGNIVKGDPVLSSLYMSLFSAVGGDGSSLEKETALAEFTGYLKEKYSFPAIQKIKTGRENSSIRRAVEFLSSDPTSKISLEELASVSGFSPYHFLRLFKEQTGKTPHVYQTELRIEKARELILKGLSAAEVAAITGFTDQSHLTRTFRKYTGATPKQYFSAN